MPRSSSAASGCLEAFGYLWLIGISIFVVGAIALSNPAAATTLAVFIIAAWVGIAIWSKKRRAAKAAAVAAAQAAEYQRQIAAQQAFQAAQHAEHQRQLAYQAAWQAEQQRLRAEKQAEDDRRLAAQQAELEQQRKERWAAYSAPLEH